MICTISDSDLPNESPLSHALVLLDGCVKSAADKLGIKCTTTFPRPRTHRVRVVDRLTLRGIELDRVSVGSIRFLNKFCLNVEASYGIFGCEDKIGFRTQDTLEGAAELGGSSRWDDKRFPVEYQGHVIPLYLHLSLFLMTLSIATKEVGFDSSISVDTDSWGKAFRTGLHKKGRPYGFDPSELSRMESES